MIAAEPGRAGAPFERAGIEGYINASLARAKIRYFLYSMYILRKDTIIALFSISVAL